LFIKAILIVSNSTEIFINAAIPATDSELTDDDIAAFWASIHQAALS